MTCAATKCGPGLEPSADGRSCNRCPPNHYSPAGEACKHCPSHSKPNAGSTYCRCVEGYYFDHWTPRLHKDEACRQCVDNTRCRSLGELTAVEGSGGTANQRTKGSWIDVESMSVLHCIPGNCISCDDAAGRDLQLDPPPPNVFLQVISESGVVRHNRIRVRNAGTPSEISINRTHPPANATCDGSSASCLDWQQQAIGTCCRLGHSGPLCATCIDGWVKEAKGLCMPCQSFDYPRLFLLVVFYGGTAVYFWYKARQIKEPKHVDQKCQSAGLVISTFFFQTAALLEVEMGVNFDIGPLNFQLNSRSATDIDTVGKCVSTGDFYVDWVLPALVAIRAPKTIVGPTNILYKCLGLGSSTSY